LLGNPLEFVAEDQLRCRSICAKIDGIADETESEPDAVEEVLSYLQNELPLLLADEDKDLVPKLHFRGEPDDDIPRLKCRLDDEHARTMTQLPKVVETLRASTCKTHSMSDSQRDLLRTFAAHIRHHLIVESAILMPLARARLKENDLDDLRVQMLRRRGLDRLMGVRDAE